MAFNRRGRFNRGGRRPMPVGGNSRANNNPGSGMGGNSRFAPRGPQRYGVNPGPMPTSGKTGGGNVGGGTMQDPRFSQGSKPMAGGQGMKNPKVHQDPRYVRPQGGNNPRIGSNRNQAFNLSRAGAGRRPVGLPNVNLRKPGSGGSRVMSRPTVGNFQRMQPRQNRLQKGVFPQGNSQSDKLGY